MNLYKNTNKHKFAGVNMSKFSIFMDYVDGYAHAFIMFPQEKSEKIHNYELGDLDDDLKSLASDCDEVMNVVNKYFSRAYFVKNI